MVCNMLKWFWCFVVFVSCSAYAQEIRVSGGVYDINTGNPLPYTSVILLDLKKGVSANASGRFRFHIDSVQGDTPVRFSCIGYTTKEVPLRLVNNAQILLKPKIEALNEVTVVAYRFKKQVLLNPFRRRRTVGLGNFSGGSYPSSLARRFVKPADFDENCFIKEVEVLFFNGLPEANGTAKFRLRILAVADDGTPGEDLLQENMIVQKHNRNRTTVNLEAFGLRVPENGFFVAVEHLFITENEYREKKTIQVNDTLVLKDFVSVKHAPIFKGVLETNIEELGAYYWSVLGWRSMARLNMGDSVIEDKIPVPAFKVILSD